MPTFYTYSPIKFTYQGTVDADVQPESSTPIPPPEPVTEACWRSGRWELAYARNNRATRRAGYTACANIVLLRALSYREEGNLEAETIALTEWRAMRAAIRAKYPDEA